MEPTDIVSHIAGHGRLQLLKHLCSLFVFMSLYLAQGTQACVHRRACVARVCVCVWSATDTEVKVTEHETWSNQKRRHEASTDSGRVVVVSLQCPFPGQK